jgi:hypothetical protein
MPGHHGHLRPQSSHTADSQSIVWVQRGRELRFTRVRGVPLAGEALGFGGLCGGASGERRASYLVITGCLVIT